MGNFGVDCVTLPLDQCVSYKDHLIPESEVSYAEGPSLAGGACGEWLKFKVHLQNKCWPGRVRLHLESCEDKHFSATVHMGRFEDERDLVRNTLPCVNESLVNNLHAESVHSNFQWDVCVADDYTYNVRYRVLKRGRFLLYVRLDGNDIAGSPFSIFISDGEASSLATRVPNLRRLKCRGMPYIQGIVDVLEDERWDIDCKNKVSDYYQTRRLATLDNLNRYSFVNELTLNLCDKMGNAIVTRKPYVRAWSTNLGRVIGVKHLGNGMVSVKYVVIVPREGLDRVRKYYSDESLLPSHLRTLGTPCSLNVQINGENVFGSPFVPEITNVPELEEYYLSFPDSLDALTLSVTDLLKQNNFEGCSRVLRNFFHSNDPCNLSVLSPEGKSDHDNSTHLKKLRESANTKDSTSELDEETRRKAVELVTRLLTQKLNTLKKENMIMQSDMFRMNHVRKHGLGELHKFVDQQYQEMLKSKTSSIIECIKELNSYYSPVDGKTKGFKNLADVMFNYTRIGDELRKLHRYDLADKFDKINEHICEEIELNRWEKLLQDRKQKTMEIKKKVDESAEKLRAFNKKVHEKYDNLEFKDIPKLPVHKEVQTIQEQTVTHRLYHLVKNRCNPTEPTNEIDRTVETFWRRCSNYDIHSTISKVLKSSIRLKNALSEVFFYYSKEYETADDMLQYAIPRVSLDQFHIDLEISKNLVNNRRKVNEMLEKFSVIRNGETVLPENMWYVYLRELAYLNLLYRIAESGDLILMRDSQHPSRLTAFHHFCEFHFLKLYEKLFTTRPEFQNFLKFYNTNKMLRSSNYKYEKESALVHYFPTKGDLANYITNEIPDAVGNGLNEDLLHLIFKHYSRLSMRGLGDASKQEPWLSTATFVIFSRDFGIVPGYMDGSAVQKIADDTILANIEQNTYQSTMYRGRLFYKDFVDALVNIISNSIYKICLNRHDMYEKSLKNNKILNITKKNKFHETRNCVQSQESVLEDTTELIQVLGLNNPSHINLTIEAIYGPGSVEHLH